MHLLKNTTDEPMPVTVRDKDGAVIKEATLEPDETLTVNLGESGTFTMEWIEFPDTAARCYQATTAPRADTP